MKKVLKLQKKIGETPLETIQKFQQENPLYQNTKLAYAGRLDPMAQGLLLVLVGEECKKRKEYERLPKEYEFEVLFGISTDTYDLMGKITKINFQPVKVPKEKLNKSIQRFKGNILQEYPPYSSTRVKGKPLFWWARQNRLDEIEIPSKRIMIYELLVLRSFSEGGRIMDHYQISAKDLLKTVHQKIEKVKGDFRQKEILKIWDEKLIRQPADEFPVAKFKINCSSGTYVRWVANEIGKELKVPSLAFSIKRTKIGDYF